MPAATFKDTIGLEQCWEDKADPQQNLFGQKRIWSKKFLNQIFLGQKLFWDKFFFAALSKLGLQLVLDASHAAINKRPSLLSVAGTTKCRGRFENSGF